MQLSGNTALITGGATGIGYAMVEAFLDAGSTVAICGRTETRLLEARAKHPGFHTRVCDEPYLMKRIAGDYWNGRRPSFPV